MKLNILLSLVFLVSVAQAESRLGTQKPTVEKAVSLRVVSQDKFNEKNELVGHVQKLITVSAKRPSLEIRRKLGAPTSNGKAIKMEAADGGIAGGNCSQIATVEVLANEITYGPNGPAVPTMLECQLGQNAPEDMFDGANVLVGQSQVIDLGPGGDELILSGKMAYPDFQNPYISSEYANNDPIQAMVLSNGDNYFDIAAAKQAQGAYGGQQEVLDILANYINPVTGEVTLPDNKILVLYELGTDNVNSPAFEFQDLVVGITLDEECEVETEVVLRDSIGTDNTTTNDNVPFASYHNNAGVPGALYVDLATLSSSQAVKITEWRGIGAQKNPNLNFALFDWYIEVWSTPEAAIANPWNGDLGNYLFDVPTVGPNLWGQTASIVPLGVKPTWEVKFDLSPYNIQIPAGGSITIGVRVNTPNGAAGLWGWMESTEVGPSDMAVGNMIPGGANYISDVAGSAWDGRLGTGIKAVTQ